MSGSSSADDRPLVVVGDLQRTSVFERLLGCGQNDAERHAIVRGIASEDPRAVVILGDLVFDGSSARHWRRFDALVEPLRARGIALEPVLGNHEYWARFGRPLVHLYERFPKLEACHWRELRIGTLSLLLLDSNQRRLPAESWRAQVAWYGERLAAIDRDPACDAAIVCLHHPPYTNSKVTGDESHVQEAFVPAFVAASKALAMFAGHAQTYEHFVEAGKHFVVSGGGGGPRVGLLGGDDRRHVDQFAGSAPRPFHYVVLDPRAPGIEVRVKGFEDPGDGVSEIDCFRLRC